MKTVRFAELVAKAGEPESYQLWVPAAKDPVFRRAVKGYRVLTVHQENVGTKKDFGVVGFHEEPQAQFLVFPKSIREFEGRRVVGVKYDLLAPDSRPTAPRRAPAPTHDAKRARSSKTKAAPRPRESRKVVRFEAPPASAAPPTAEARPTRQGAPEKPAAVKPQPERTPLERRLLAEVSRALRELETGKSVAAYKRLQRLTDAAGKG
jgi:hypothetical protein